MLFVTCSTWSLALSAPVRKPAAKPTNPAATVKPAQKVAVLPGTVVALPAECKVKVRWVCPPLDAKTVREAYWFNVAFAVDSTGRPWIGDGYDDILNPTEQYRFVLSRPYEDMVCLENGVFLVATSSDLGFIVPPEKPKVNYDGIPMATFQPLAGLPFSKCRLFAGASNCVYLTGRNPETEQYEVYVLRRQKLTTDGMGVRAYEKVFSCKREINAVAGDGDTTFVAVDRLVMKVPREGNDPVKVHVSPSETITGLAYSPDTGLFCSTQDSISYIGTGGVLDIMAAPNPRIYLQKGSLYVLFRDTLGLIALDGIGDLKRFSKPIKEVPATQSSEVKVTAIRFFEAGETPPDYANRKYATKFDKATTRYVYCQIDMVNLLYGKRSQKQKVTMEVEWPGNMGWTSSETIDFEIPPDLKDVWGWARFGDASPGTLYPGKYAVRTYLNGNKIDERHFTVEGEMNMLEAASVADTARLWKLLDTGADANERNGDGQTPLMLAVSAGSLEAVRLLLDNKADVNAKDNAGETALMIAASRHGDNPAMVRILLEHGADPNAANNEGETALHKAAASNALEVMRLLLEHGANPNAKDNDGDTPMFELTLDLPGYAYQAKPEHVELLLRHGADVNAIDRYRESALLKAMDGRSIEIVRMLLDHGADVNMTYRYESGDEYSALGHALVSYNLESDRAEREKLREIMLLLCERGATLRSEEISYGVATGTINLLGRKHIKAILDSDNKVILSYQPEDPWLRKYVLWRIIGLAYANISWAQSEDGYAAALDVCTLAKDRLEQWKMEAECPEVYFDCGLLSAKLGRNSDAKAYLERYLSLAPNGQNAERAKAMLASL